MFNIVLFEPEIPPNTGNVIRLCANTGCQLHLIEPLGFVMDDKRLRRAGLDYGEWREVRVHPSWQAFLTAQQPQRLFAVSTKGRQHFHQLQYHHPDYFVMGPETRGLPMSVLDAIGWERVLRTRRPSR